MRPTKKAAGKLLEFPSREELEKMWGALKRDGCSSPPPRKGDALVRLLESVDRRSALEAVACAHRFRRRWLFWSVGPCLRCGVTTP